MVEMNAVGIDVSKGKSMVVALRPMGEVVISPKEFLHTASSLKELCAEIVALGSDTKVVMEATGRYHEPVATILHENGIFVCVLNPIVIKQSGAGSVRKVKNDKKDALKIAKYGLDNWTKLREYNPMDTIREKLKLFSRQYDTHIKTVTAMKNNLISLLDKTFPGANDFFDSPARDDGHQKWVDFVSYFWHCDIVADLSLDVFTKRYQKWCKRNGYNFSASKAETIHAKAIDLCTTLPKDNCTKLLITSSVSALTSILKVAMAVRAEAISLAKQLPEYETVLSMYGVGEITAAQLIAELGDVRRFANRGSIVAFAGIDPEVNESGTYSRESNPVTKRGPGHLRKTLYQVICTYLKKSPTDEPVYKFLDKKRSEGKPYFVYMTAAANKFLRIYFARVKEALIDLPDNNEL